VTARDRIALTVVIAAVLVGGFWFLVLGPQRSKASKLGSELNKEQQRLTTAQSDATQSRAARAEYSRNYATVARLGKAVPSSDDVPSLVYQLSSTAQATGVDFRTIKLQNASNGAAAAPASATPAPSPGKGSSGSTPASGSSGSTPASGSSAAAPASATQAATATLPPGAVVGPAGFPTMPFSFTFEGSFFRLSSFFSRLESQIQSSRGRLSVRGRLLTIDGLALTAAGQGFPHMKAAVAATAYLLPADQGLTNGATPSTPPAGSAQPVKSTSTTGATPPAATAGAVR
jgi:type II secretory pathway component PulM